MYYCSKCGTQAQEGAQFCQSCGTVIGAASTQPNQQTQQVVPQNSDAEENKGMAILAYIIFFIPLLTGDSKKSPFVKYHTNQGTLLFLFTLALGVAINLVLALLRAVLWGWYTWGIFGILSTLLNLLWLAPTVLFILGVINAANGRMKPLPVIGDKFTIIK